MADSKWCSRCKTEKPVTEFDRANGTVSGLKCYCRECSKEANRIWYQRNRDRQRDRKRAKWQKLKDPVQAAM